MTYQEILKDQPDLQKVLKGLEICSPDFCTKERRNDCPYYGGPETDYWSNPDGYGCEYDVRHDAIKLLRAQDGAINHLKNSIDSMIKASTKK